jgi:isopentenyl diphosphate isomerase/L-lactate dehydrogenase-like FMN-dependent dehydrogenase
MAEPARTPGDTAVAAVGERFQVLHELVSAARANLERGTWDYLIGGAESETTLRRNRQAIESLAFRPRVLRDVSHVDPSVQLLGMNLRIPVMLAPIGSLQDFDPGGGAVTAKAAADAGIVSMLSSACAPGLEEVARATDGPRIYQLYVRGDAAWVDDHVARAIEHRYTAFCLTVDLDYYGRRERDLAKRFVTTARRNPGSHEHQMAFSWADIERIRSKCDIPLILKGIATAEDTRIACEHGVDVVYVSNHGGRQLDHGRGALDVLPEVVQAAEGRARVMVDGGFLRGTDVVKAMALGASAVGVGRLTGFAIAAGGYAGVVRMIELLELEIRTCLGLLGVETFAELDESHLHPARPVTVPHVTSAFPLLDEDY